MDASVSIAKSLDYLREIISKRLNSHLNGTPFDLETFDFDLLNLYPDSPLYKFIEENSLTKLEFILLILVLAPHINPTFLDSIVLEFLPQPGDFPEFGSVKGRNTRGILPTFQTFLFIVGGNDLDLVFSARTRITNDHFLFANQIIKSEDIIEGEPFINGKIYLVDDYVEFFITGKLPRPKFGSSFPAKLLTTKLNWEDLVLNSQTEVYVNELASWLIHKETLYKTRTSLNRDNWGYRALFYGPPGTGKTITAILLGKITNLDVYRIDLSLLSSKYIGETEKNISGLFNKAKDKDWILFFDEAEGLFSRRTDVKNSTDKYANQEVSFLLQEIERYSGMVILATNNFNRIDDAFKRRFQSILYFSFPRAKERKRIWEKSIPANLQLDKDLDIESIAKEFELSGADIVNAMESIRLRLITKGSNVIKLQDVLFAVKKEYSKYGKILKQE